MMMMMMNHSVGALMTQQQPVGQVEGNETDDW